MSSGCNYPLVSVIVPTYNSSSTLEACIHSIKIQTYPNKEVIVADNFSGDSTAQISKNMGATVLLNCGRPRNPGSCRNQGLRKSAGQYILFLDSDETLSRLVIEECVELCRKDDFGMVKIPLVFVGKGVWGASSAYWRNCHYRISKHTIGNFPRFFKRECIPDTAYDEDLRWGEDLELYTRMRSKRVSEAYCTSIMLHQEPTGLKEMISKNIFYAGATATYERVVGSQVYPLLLSQAFLAFGEMLQNPPRSMTLLAGLFFFLSAKSIAMAVGSLRNRWLS